MTETPSATTLVRMTGITKSFGSVTVLKNARFKIEAGEVHVLARENGAEKSTLIKTLAGVHTDFEGWLVYNGREVRPRNPLEANALGVAINRFEEYGPQVRQIINCGGVTDKNPLMMQIYADVTDRPIYISRSAQTCALGVVIAKTLAIESGGHDIRANAIAPEAVGGQRIENVLAGCAKAEGKSVEDERANMFGIQSLKGFVDPKGIAELGGGLAVTGNYSGKARTPDELRDDLEKAYSLIPGNHRLNLHAFYGEFGGRKVNRDEIEPKHFANWISWAEKNGLGLDFNPTCFSNPKAADGFTLTHPDKGIREFWIEHCMCSREIGMAMGKALGKTSATNLWITDDFIDTPADRVAPRERLVESLDTIFQKKISPQLNLDAMEPKLFGIDSESYVVGSQEFYLGYAVSHKKLLTLEAGHYHPTESIADKISSVLQFMPEILLHIRRGVRWESDHVVILNDELLAIAREIIANGYGNCVHMGLDYFDASINHVAAWTIGTRNMLRALLIALLEPPAIKIAEVNGDFTTRLAVQEEAKSLPFGAVWDFYCESNNVPVGGKWAAEVKHYEKNLVQTVLTNN